ncbi:tRNA (5-methylaminomethyl-2-thiouridine)(34)-methyltransferase MnmD [Meiothermus sp.]|uniref:tRNA (5-methylaminomethyl-2-thiouridine)(34)-methyltransferase MnmD n=1 Tax=Meiothermus sp. TaxID=1955249 RepID=UPI00307F4042
MTDKTSNFEPLVTEDGSLTLVHPVFGEAYSSKYGAWMQANELYLKLTQTHRHPSPRVLEIGFGLGFNFRATLENCLSRGVAFEYLSYEAFPVDRKTLALLRTPISPPAQAIWKALLARWPAQAVPSVVLAGEWGRLEIRFEDVTHAEYPLAWASAIYLDPFSPEVNPAPWGLDNLRRLYASARQGAYLATYSVAGQFRRALGEAGFAVQKVPGIGKKHWSQAQRL